MKKVMTLIFLALGMLNVQHSTAQGLEKFQSIFIITFIENIDWPNSKPTIKVGILGNSRVLPELSSKVKERGLNIVVSKVDYLDEIAQYDLVFIPKSQSGLAQKATSKVKGKSVLIVADDSSLAQLVEIAFFMEGQKLKFTINKANADRKGFRISSRLLGFAKIL